MKFKNNFKNKFLKIFICFLISITIIFCLFFYINNKNNDIIFKYFKNITLDINNIFVRKNKKHSFSNKTLVEENKVLRKEIKKYKKMIDIKTSLTDKNITYVSVLNRNTSSFYSFITINKGKKDNIKEGSAVLNEYGLIGKVEKVYKNSSLVSLISTKKRMNYISSMFYYNDKYYYGLIDGYDNIKKELKLKNVIGDFDDDVIGKTVLTSGLTENFPEGLIIGKIKRVEKDKYKISNNIYVSLMSDIDDLSILYVVNR